MRPSSTRPPSPPTGYSHQRCYARELADCSTDISAEHYVSEMVINAMSDDGPPKAVQVTRPAWNWDGKKIGIASLVSNMLCRRHNSALSSLDTAAGLFVERLKDADRRCDAGGGRHAMSGIDLERWLLKVLCGMVHIGGKMDVPSTWVRHLFGVTEITPPCGFHMNVVIGETLGEKGEFSVEPASNEARELVGCAITIHAHRLLLSLDGNRVVRREEIGGESVLRPAHLRWKNLDTGAGYRIFLDWPVGTEGPGVNYGLKPFGGAILYQRNSKWREDEDE